MGRISACRRMLRKIELELRIYAGAKRVEARVVHINHKAKDVHAVTGIIICFTISIIKLKRLVQNIRD